MSGHTRKSEIKSFEDKARGAIIHYMQTTGIKLRELDRIIKDGDRHKAEWEGVFEIHEIHVYFVECTHTNV
jgi:hypothetical protein